MGKSQSRMEEARKEIADLEAKGDSPRLRERLNEYVRICRSEGELNEAVACLNKLLELQEKQSDNPLELAATMYLLGNTLRLQLQPVLDSGKPSPFTDEKERTKAYARAEDLLLRSLEIRSEALKSNTESRELKFAVARAKSALAMIQNSYGGNTESAQLQHEGALEMFAEFPLASDPEGWTYNKGVWTSSKLGVVVSPVQSPPPAPSFTQRPNLLSEESRSFRIDSKVSDQQFRSQRATTTNTHNIQAETEDGSLTDDDSPAPKASAKRSTKWRLVIKLPRVSERRPSALERLRRIGSFQNQIGLEAFEGIVQKIDLEPGHRVEIVLPLSESKKNQLRANGITYVTLGTKEKLGKVISERHCIFEEDTKSDDAQSRWTVSDPHSTSKYKGILVNGIRVMRAPLRPGDVIQLGSCSKVKMGTSAIVTDRTKRVSREPFANGLEYQVERVITTIDDADVSSVAPSALFEASDSADTAFRHFHLLAVAAQMNLNGPPLTMDQTSDLFALAVKSGVPFHLWDSWIYSELSKTRLIS